MAEHPVIQLFRTHSTSPVTGALSMMLMKLAGWIGLAKNLSEDDIAILANIGGIRFRDGLARRENT